MQRKFFIPPQLAALAAILLIGIALPIQTFAATVTASLERNPIRINEIGRLIISVDDPASNQSPDVSPLEKDFNVLGSSRSTNISITNGLQTSSTRWVVQLEPKREGTIPIPPVFVGQDQTKPLTLMVLAATAGNSKPHGMFIEVEAEPEEPYVQGQINYIIRLYVSNGSVNGSLHEPKAGRSVIQKLGNDASFEANRDNKHYRVIERRYAIFPQKSGTLEIEPIRFVGQITDANKSSPAREVVLRSETLTINVKPQPPGFTGKNWLPAREVALVETWSGQNPTFRVGEPITRTLKLKATGLKSAQIPPIDLGETDGFRTYPEQSEQGEELADKWLVGIRSQSIAFVPTRSGAMTIPEVRVPWWDVTTNEQRIATIPARTVTVAAAIASDEEANQNTQDLQAVDNSVKELPATSILQNRLLWPAIALAALFSWLLTLLMWWLDKRKTKTRVVAQTESPQLGELVRSIKTACKNNDAVGVRQALVQWARVRWPGARTVDLDQIATRLGNADLTQELSELDKNLYAPSDTAQTTWHGTALWKCFDLASRETIVKKTKQYRTALPALYPAAG
ncbi:MAG: BatD family protein [Arenicellales bacterium WSBS_2016_MAG_OTU3]